MTVYIILNRNIAFCIKLIIGIHSFIYPLVLAVREAPSVFFHFFALKYTETKTDPIESLANCLYICLFTTLQGTLTGLNYFNMFLFCPPLFIVLVEQLFDFSRMKHYNITHRSIDENGEQRMRINW